MQLDDRAISFIQNAKAQGFSKEQVAQYLQNKGYDLGLPAQAEQAPAQPDNYSALDKAKYMLRAAGEGATLGLGDLVAGQADVLASDAAGITQADNWKDRAKATTDLAVHALVPAASLLSDRFNKGRNAFIREQQAFAQAHPVLNFTGEMGGGLVTGIVGAGKKLATTAGKQGLKALAGEGAREGAKFGTAYGAGSGLTEEENKLSIADALKGAGSGLVGGAVLGAALPVGIAGVAKGVKGVSGALRKAGQILDADAMGAAVPQATAKQAPQIYVNEWGDIVTPKALQRLLETDENAVQQAVKEGVPLLDLADQKMLGTASGVRLASPEAEQIFTTYGRERLAGQHPKIVTALKQYFGNKGSHQLLDELNADVQKGAKVLYDKAVYQVDKAGNVLYDNAGKPLGKVLPELEKLNKYELDYVGKVYGTKGLEYEVQGLPQNDMRILNYAKQLMDDDIQRLTNQGHNNQARILAEKRAAFIEKIDKANPEYKTARSFFERGKRAETALQEGKKALKGERSNLEYDFNRLTPEEQAFYRKGVGNALEEMSNMQASGGNPAHKVFGEETLRRLKQLGIKDMDKLEKFARAESKASSNIQRLLQGSPTAEREMQAAREVGGELNVGGAIVNPKRTFKRSVANTINKQVKKIINDTSAQDRIEIARLLTDPEYLAKQVNEVNRLRGAQRANLERIRAGQVANSVKQAIQGEQKPSGSVLNALANKIKEEKGFVANPLSEGEGKISKILSEKANQLKRDLKVLGYDDNVFYADVVHAPSKENLSKINTYKSIIDGKIPFNEKMIDLGEVPQKLLDGGMENRNLYIGYGVIKKAQGGKNVGHDLSAEVLKEVPEKLYNPIAVLDSRNPLGGSVVVTELKDKAGKPVVAAIRLDKTPKGVVINDIKSIHGRNDFDQLFGFSLDEGKLRKIDAKKMENIPSSYRATIAHGSDRSPNHSIVNEAGNVKTQFLDIDGVKRPTTNSEGQPIAKNSFGVNNFWDAFKGSKVVNEQGKPLVVYHGTSNKFNTFKGKKHFFTSSKDLAEAYGSEGAMPVYLDIKNPLVVDAYGQSFDNIVNAQGFKKMQKDLTAKDYQKLAKRHNMTVKEIKEFFPNEGENMVNLAEAYGQKGMSADAWADYAKKNGYDGVIIKDVVDNTGWENADIRATDFIVFEPTQIKSVKNQGTFDPKNPNIYKSLIGGLGISQILKNKENK